MFYFASIVVLQNALVIISLMYLIKKENYGFDIPSILMLWYALSNLLFAIYINR